jgi:small subunit ribosomal protein S1
MENLEKNDSTKDLSLNALSDESAGKQSDEAGIEEKEILKTDTSVEDALSHDVQNENDAPVEVRESDETPVEAGKSDETPVEILESDETPVEILESDETPVEILESDETPVEVLESDETPVEVRESDETPVEIRESDDGSESVRKPSEKSETDQEPSVSLEKVQKPADDMESLMDMYEESFKRFAEGAVVTGRIISVDKDHVLVDIGYKSEGQIRTQEFMDEDGNLNANIGDPVDVMVEWWDDEEERVVLSKEKAAKVKVWEDIKKVYEEERTVEGVIINRVKGGFSVDIGVQAFLPGSQADLRPIRKLDEMVGKTFTFKILKYNRKRSNIVLSRRAILEEERSASRASTLASIHDGKVVEGIIKNITEYGVFVDLGGVDGLLHITDISWGRVKHPSELFSVGDKITVKVLNLDIEKERVSLGKKQLTEDPWLTASEKYPVGSRIIGRVVSLTDYGAFVELEEGIEGLIHVSEMSWTRKIRHPSKVVSVGEEVEAVVLDIRPENRRRISLTSAFLSVSVKESTALFIFPIFPGQNG